MKKSIKELKNVLVEYAYERDTHVTHPLLLMYMISLIVMVLQLLAGLLITLVIIPISIAEASIMLYDWYDKKYRFGKRLIASVNNYYKIHHKNIKSYYLQSSITSQNIIPFDASIYEDIEDFIRWFIRHGKDQCYTMHNGVMVCDLNRRRSAGDIWLITKHYFPTCTFEELMKCLIKLSLDNDIPITCSYCTTIHKLVFFVDYRDVSMRSRTEYSDDITLGDLIKIYK